MNEEEKEKIIKNIFNNQMEYADTNIEVIKNSKDYNLISGLVELLKESTREEDIQKYLSANPKILLNLFNSYDNRCIAFINKPKIGNQHIADFAIFRIDQGGRLLHLIEIERCIDKLFTKERSPTHVFQKAISQVQDWKQWIDRNSQTFSEDFIRMVKKLPGLSENKSSSSFRMKDIKQIENFWDNFFHGNLTAVLEYHIIIGRYSNLTKEERERLEVLNQDHFFSISSYEQMVRSIYKPFEQFHR